MTLFRLGNLALDETGGSTYKIESLSSEEGTDFGNPEPIEIVLRSLLQDGSVVVSQGYDNREVNIAVTVSAATSGGLDQAEAALFSQLGKRTTLTLTPPDRWGPPSVFDVLTSNLLFTTDDMGEVHHERVYGIRLVCLPFARAEIEIVSEAPALVPGAGEQVDPVFTTLDDASSLTRWSSSSDAPNLVDGNTAVRKAGFNGANLIFTPAAPVAMTGTPYLVVDFKASRPAALNEFIINGVTISPESVGPSPFVNFLRAIIEAPATVNRLEVRSTAPGLNSAITVTNVARASFPPGVGTSRQLFRTLAVRGSARTEGALEISHETSALGDVLTYTCPDDGSGYLPALTTMRVTSGTTTPDSTTVSGSTNVLDSTVTYDIPVETLPDGTYLLQARLKSTVVGVQGINYSAQSRVGGLPVGVLLSGSGQVPFDTTGVYQIATLGVLELPPTRLASGVVRLTLVATDPAASDITIDETWLFNLTTGSLSQVSCGTGLPVPGGPSNRVWIEPATADFPLPSVLRGNAEDGSDAYAAGPSLVAWGQHEFVPSSMVAFTVTTEALNASTRLRHYPRGHSHIAPEFVD